MAAEFVLILPPGLAPSGGETTQETPYGTVTARLTAEGLPVLLRAEGADARSLIYAAKALGAQRVLAGDQVAAVSPLLEPGDLVVPADAIDQTRLRPFTFFVGKGYGFIKLNPPFCPDLMAALYEVGRSRQPRTFGGATYVGTDGARDATDAECRMYRHWGVDVAGGALLPEAYLARELELHYAALAVVEGEAAHDLVQGEAARDGLLCSILTAVAARQPGRLSCTCAETMKFMKQQGVVGEDWRTW